MGILFHRDSIGRIAVDLFCSLLRCFGLLFSFKVADADGAPLVLKPVLSADCVGEILV